MSNEETYTIIKTCNNCQWEGKHEIPKGILVTDAVCNNCGCKALGNKTTVTSILNPRIGSGKAFPSAPLQPAYIGDSPNAPKVMC